MEQINQILGNNLLFIIAVLLVLIVFLLVMQVLVTTLPDLLSIWHAFHCICISLITIFKNTRILWLF